MKKLLLTILVFLISLNLVSALGTIINDQVQVNVIQLNPSIISPGDDFDIYLQIENSFDDSSNIDLKNTYIKFLDDYPFYLVESDTRVQYLGSILEGSTKEVKYKIKVDPSCLDGSYDLKFMVMAEGLGNKIGSIKLDVQSRNAILDIAKIQTIPEQISPGEKGQVKITLSNPTSSLMRDITIKLDLSLSVLQESLASTAASISDEIPIAPISSGTEKKIASIQPGKEAVFTYDIIVYPDAKAKVYKIPLTITYYDNFGTNYTKEEVIGLVIGGMPDLSANVESTTIYSSGSTGNVILKIINKGPIDVKFLNIKLEESEDYKIISPDESYIGSIDSDDYETAEFRIDLKTRNKKVNLPIIVEYKDNNNQDYNQKINVELNIHSQKELGIAKSNNSLVTFLIIIILAIFFFHHRSWKKKNKEKSMSDYFKYLISKLKFKRVK